MASLTDKERAYCRYYVANGGNGTQAAISAGYARASASVQSAKLQKKATIKAEIAMLKGEVAKGTLHLLAAPVGGGNQGPPPLDGTVLEPGESGPRRPPQPEPDDPTIMLTRQFIVGQLVRNVAIAMGDEDIEQRVMVKARKTQVKAGENGEPIIAESVDVVVVRVTDRNGAVANQALNLLDQQLDKIKAERGTVPQEARYLLDAHQDRLATMRQRTKAAIPT